MNEKTRKIINRICAVIAVASAIATVLLLPPVKSFLKGSEPDAPVIETTAPESPSLQNGSETSEPLTESAPDHTTALMNNEKNYTLFIDARNYDFVTEKGATTIVAKDNKNVKMVITPERDKPYSVLCDEMLNFYQPLSDSEKLDITSENSAFRSQSGDTDADVITTVYCVDDGNGGSVEIVEQLPVNAQGYEKSFDIFLSTFKIL